MAQPTPTPSSTVVTVGVSPSASPSSDEVPVPSQVLPPASDPPAAQLCSKPIVKTADGNATPLTCSTGALNVQAWTYYSTISASILSLGANPSPAQPQSAMCDDIAHNGASRAQEANGYRLASLYYGWTFNLDPTKISCQ